MGNKDYNDFFEGCLKGEFTIKSYLKEEKRIKKIIEYSKNSNYFKGGFYIDDINMNRVTFTQEVLKLFKKVINDKKTEYLDYSMDSMMKIGLEPFNLVYLLKLIMFDDYFFTSYPSYTYGVDKFCIHFDNIYPKTNIDEPRLFTLTRIYNKYRNDDSLSREDALALNGVGYRLVSDFNLTDLDPIYLDKLFLKAILNGVEETLTKYENIFPTCKEEIIPKFVKRLKSDIYIPHKEIL